MVERFVRPFQQVGVTPPIRVGEQTPQTPEIVRITPGIVGSVKATTGDYSASQTAYLNQRQREEVLSNETDYVDLKLDQKEPERKMAIQRVRNRKYPTQNVDIAFTTALFITRQNENSQDKFSPGTFQRNSKEADTARLADVGSQSPTFDVKSSADLTKESSSFRAQMGDA